MSGNDYYLVDGKRVYWGELIKMAERYDDEYLFSTFKTTSRAAAILRDNGHAVEEATNEP